MKNFINGVIVVLDNPFAIKVKLCKEVRDVRIKYLEYFLEVVKAGSISHAATKLYISQQGLSRIIQTIEQDFEIQLFDRNNNVLELTPEGKRFAEEAVNVTTAYKQLQVFAASCGELPEPEHEYIKIITTPFVLTSLFPKLEDFFHASPFKDMLRISEKSISEILYMPLSASDKNIHIISIPEYAVENISKRVGHFEPLMSTEILLLVNKQSPIAKREYIENHEICSLPLIYYHEDLLENILNYLCGDIDTQDYHMKLSDVHRIMQNVKQNEAVTITDALSKFLYDIPDTLTTIPIKESVSLVLGILTSPYAAKSANDAAFVEFFKKCLRVLCGPYLKQNHYTF